MFRAHGVTVGQVTQNALQKISLGVELEQIGFQTATPQFVVNLCRPDQIGWFQCRTAEFRHLGPACTGRTFAVFQAKQFGCLIVIFNRRHDTALAILGINFFTFVYFGTFFAQFGRLSETTRVREQGNRALIGLHGIDGIALFERGAYKCKE